MNEDTNQEEDIVFSPEEEEENPGAVIKKLRAKLRESEQKAEEYLSGWQKERADLANARRRDAEDKETFSKFAGEKIVMDLIPALDSFEMALKFKDTNPEDWEKLPETWRKGIEYIHSQLMTALGNHGVKVVNPTGEEFDHNRDEAFGTVPTEKESEDNKILQVIQPGYTMNGKTIRTAKVKVGELKS